METPQKNWGEDEAAALYKLDLGAVALLDALDTLVDATKIKDDAERLAFLDGVLASITPGLDVADQRKQIRASEFLLRDHFLPEDLKEISMRNVVNILVELFEAARTGENA